MITALLAAAVVAPKPILAGYLPAWGMANYKLTRLKPLTDVIYFSVQPTAEGGLETKDINLADLPKLAATKRRYGFRLLLCCGGWERSAGFAPMASDPARRKRFVGEVAAFLAKHGFDGIDLDWEHPKDAAEARAYGQLIQDLKRGLGGRLVTAAKAAWQSMDPLAVQNLDRLHLMSYDHPGRHATVEQAKADVEKLRAAGFRPAQIVLGVPLYGRSLKDWNDAKPFAEILRAFSPKRDADEAGGYFYNGAATVAAKARFAREQGLSGLMVWEVTQDAPGEDSLLAVMRKSL